MRYRNWEISYDPPPIPTSLHDWTAVHMDYDGPEDGRCITCCLVEEAMELVDEWEEDQ